MFDEEYRLWNFSLWHFLQPPNTSSLMGPDVLKPPHLYFFCWAERLSFTPIQILSFTSFEIWTIIRITNQIATGSWMINWGLKQKIHDLILLYVYYILYLTIISLQVFLQTLKNIVWHLEYIQSCNNMLYVFIYFFIYVCMYHLNTSAAISRLKHVV